MNGRDRFRHFYLLSILTLTSPVFSAQNTNQQVDEAVKAHLDQQVADYAAQLGSSRYQINIVPLAPLKLPPCQHIPEISSIGQSTKVIGRVTRKVICAEPKWSLNIRARVDIFLPVVKSKSNIGRNTMIRAQDLVIEDENIASLRGDYYSSIKEVTGLRSRRQITANRVIQPSMTERPALVTRNASVVIHAGSKGFSITMKGKALQEGSLGEQIQVRNTSSGKVIMAEVTGQGVVKIID